MLIIHLVGKRKFVLLLKNCNAGMIRFESAARSLLQLSAILEETLC
jgi:hypothetical protein